MTARGVRVNSPELNLLKEKRVTLVYLLRLRDITDESRTLFQDQLAQTMGLDSGES